MRPAQPIKDVFLLDFRPQSSVGSSCFPAVFPAGHVRQRVQRPRHLDSHAARHRSLLQVPVGTSSPVKQDLAPSDSTRLTCFPYFSRRFAVVEKRWRTTWEAEGGGGTGDGKGAGAPLPTDHEVAAAFAERRKREGTARGSGIRTTVSSVGSDSWVDDPITRHIISLHIGKVGGDGFMLWPVVLQKRGGYYVLVLPMVDPQSFRAYENLLKRSDCGSSAKENGNLSSILLNLPCITG
ncbi:hypothetical protein PR202_ga12286 [Eleusine coracana subsp. coracana]|uniref:Uncharacterized protein n=1 Tax=Eleusine coracana subsp. coracana TaxID=191504 RepID=A0AAV5CBN6_ELECO|nr:hypothetical protein PR202_ga12286 [Eleusine coracana subsp. coracana]